MNYHKLISPAGNFIGHISIPPEWEKELAYMSQVSFSVWDAYERVKEGRNPKTASIHKSWAKYPMKGVVLYGIDLEEFKHLPDCVFVPNSAYVGGLR